MLVVDDGVLFTEAKSFHYLGSSASYGGIMWLQGPPSPIEGPVVSPSWTWLLPPSKVSRPDCSRVRSMVASGPWPCQALNCSCITPLPRNPKLCDRAPSHLLAWLALLARTCDGPPDPTLTTPLDPSSRAGPGPPPQPKLMEPLTVPPQKGQFWVKEVGGGLRFWVLESYKPPN